MTTWPTRAASACPKISRALLQGWNIFPKVIPSFSIYTMMESLTWNFNMEDLLINLLSRVLGCFLFSASLPLVQSSSCLPSLSQSTSTFHGLKLCSLSFSLSDSFVQPPHFHLTDTSVSAPTKLRLHLRHHQGLDSWGSCPKSYHRWDSILPRWSVGV